VQTVDQQVQNSGSFSCYGHPPQSDVQRLSSD
jgi:hypothetical protein